MEQGSSADFDTCVSLATTNCLLIVSLLVIKLVRIYKAE